MRRSFLFLQGVCSPFFAALGRQLQDDGQRVFKVNFTAGDWVYWAPLAATNYRAGVAGVRDFLDRTYHEWGITDQILFGDRRPIHRPAVDRASALGIRTHVFEEGYFRPHWVTLEREGVNGHSLLPRDPDWFRTVGAGLPDDGHARSFNSPFRARAAHDFLYHCAGIANPLFFPGYRSHAPVNVALEYAGYLRRLAMLRFWGPRDDRLIEELVLRGVPYYVLPLQLSSDAQIRDHSRFDDMQAVLAFVVESFARHAPTNVRLVVKNHPLDAGLTSYRRIIRELDKQYELGGRVDYLESGDLGKLLPPARGVVTVNSTAGCVALGFGTPTVTLSDPIYDLPGLTFQGTLDEFWRTTYRPDTELFRCFRNTVVHATQVNGGFYSAGGIRLAVSNSRRFLVADRSPLEELL